MKPNQFYHIVKFLYFIYLNLLDISEESDSFETSWLYFYLNNTYEI